MEPETEDQTDIIKILLSRCPPDRMDRIPSTAELDRMLQELDLPQNQNQGTRGTHNQNNQ